MRDVFFALVCAFLFTPVLLFGSTTLFAQVMQSGSYRIQSDSINTGGGFSSSTSYVQESTAGEIATGESQSASFKLKAGYQQMQEVYIAITDTTSVLMTPSIPGISGGTSNGSTTVTVTTDSPSGYELSINAESSPAMQKGGDTIADYVPTGNPDFSFDTAATDAHFGYTPEGVHVVSRFLDNTTTCNVGSTDTSLACWDGLSTTREAIASNSISNHPSGSTTTIHFRVGIGTLVAQPPGVYIATTTLTALPL